jgi:hypothetical protein
MEALLNNSDVRAELKLAWDQSQPGPSGEHEEGGFIVRGPAGKLQVIRWPRGAGNTIEVPPHPGCSAEGLEIIASFHTHPNTRPDYMQEPSQTDKRAVRDDPELKGADYGSDFGRWQRRV